MIYFIIQLFAPNTAEDISELMSLDTGIIAPIFMVMGIICMICWLKDRKEKK